MQGRYYMINGINNNVAFGAHLKLGKPLCESVSTEVANQFAQKTKGIGGTVSLDRVPKIGALKIKFGSAEFYIIPDEIIKSESSKQVSLLAQITKYMNEFNRFDGITNPTKPNIRAFINKLDNIVRMKGGSATLSDVYKTVDKPELLKMLR